MVRDRGGRPSITPLGTSKDRVYVGVDTLDLMYQLAWDEDAYASTMAALEDAKEAAAGEGADERQTAVLIGNTTWMVRPAGARLGGGGGPFMRYQLEHAGMVLQLARQAKPDGDQPNVALHLGAMIGLACGDLETLVKRARAVLASLGGRVVSEKVSRLDVFCDLENQDSESVVWDFLAGKRIMRMRKGTEFGLYTEGLAMQGMRIGRGSLFRVYDKVAELQRQAVKRATWEAVEWGGNPPEVCTRFEFQLRRSFLKDRAIDDLDDLAAMLGALLAYLVGDGSREDRAWVRFTEDVPDRTNTTRAESAGYWKRVQDAFKAHTPTSGKLTRAVTRPPAVRHLMEMAAGCLEMVAAMSGEKIDHVDDFAGFVTEQIYAHLGIRSFCRSIDEKRAKLRAMTPDMPTMDGGGLCFAPYRSTLE